MRQLKNLLFLLFSIISALSLAVSITILAGGGIYRLYLNFNDLATPVGLTKSQLLENIDHMMGYLISPFQNILAFPHFSSSEGALQHFAEVKHLMLFNFVLSIIAIVFIIWQSRAIKKKGERLLRLAWLKLAYYFPILMLFFVVVAFDKLFVLFHQIFFRNDLWLFNPATDPIIYVLPQGLFMIYFIVGLVTYLLLIYIFRKIL